jgi:hypothetical protein
MRPEIFSGTFGGLIPAHQNRYLIANNILNVPVTPDSAVFIRVFGLKL